MKNVFGFVNALGWGWKGLGILAIAFLLWKGIVSTWNKVAFANPSVKELVVALDSANTENKRQIKEILIQRMQLATFESEVNYYVGQISKDSANYKNMERSWQINYKKLQNKNKELEDLNQLYISQGEKYCYFLERIPRREREDKSIKEEWVLRECP